MSKEGWYELHLECDVNTHCIGTKGNIRGKNVSDACYQAMAEGWVFMTEGRMQCPFCTRKQLSPQKAQS